MVLLTHLFCFYLFFISMFPHKKNHHLTTTGRNKMYQGTVYLFFTKTKNVNKWLWVMVLLLLTHLFCFLFIFYLHVSPQKKSPFDYYGRNKSNKSAAVVLECHGTVLFLTKTKIKNAMLLMCYCHYQDYKKNTRREGSWGLPRLTFESLRLWLCHVSHYYVFSVFL